MNTYDLILRNADIATAGDRYTADIGVRDGRICAIAQGLDASAAREIDARGRLVTPGGVDGHCHFDQPTSDGSRFADDFLSGTRSAHAAAPPPCCPSPRSRRAAACRRRWTTTTAAPRARR